MERKERAFWRLDEAAQRRLSFVMLYEKNMAGWTMKELAERIRLSKNFKTLDHYMKGRSQWKPEAVKAAVEFLLEGESRISADQFLQELKSPDFDYRHDWESKAGCTPWHPGERSAVQMADDLASAEEHASSSLTFGIYPPLWLMPRRMMDRHLEWLLKSCIHDKVEYRTGLVRLSNARADRFFSSPQSPDFRRTIVMRYQDFKAMIERTNPMYRHFSSDDIHEFLKMLVTLHGRRTDFLFQVTDLDDWDGATDFSFIGAVEHTFIGNEMCWFGQSFIGPTFWFISRQAGGPWPHGLTWIRRQILNLLQYCPEGPDCAADLKLFFERERQKINAPPMTHRTPIQERLLKAKQNIADFLRSIEKYGS